MSTIKSHPQLIPYVQRPPTKEELFIRFIEVNSHAMRELIADLESPDPPGKSDLKMVLSEYATKMQHSNYDITAQYHIIKCQARSVVGVVSNADLDINIFYGGDVLKKLIDSGELTFSSAMFVDI